MTLCDFQYPLALALGLILGTVELMARYRDEPSSIFGSRAAWGYIVFNGILSVFSLVLIMALGLNFAPKDGNDAAATIYNIMMAGFGGAAFFRSSILQTRAGDKNIAVGPGLVIDTLLGALDRAVDRYRAKERSRQIELLLGGITLRQASETIAPYCLNLMQNLTSSERAELEKEIARIEEELLTESKSSTVKAVSLLLKVAELVGFDVLGKAIMTLRKLGALPEQDSPAAPPASSKLDDAFDAVEKSEVQ